MEWAFEVIDRLNGPMQKMDAALRGFDKSLKDVDKDLRKFELEQRKVDILQEEDPLRQRTKALRFYRDLLQEQKHALEEQHGKAVESAGAYAQIGTFALEAASRVAEFTERVADLGIELYKSAAEASDANKKNLASLDIMLGGKRAALEMKDALDGMAIKSGVSADALFQQFQTLAPFTKQFGKRAAQDVMSAVQDVKLGFGDSAGQAVLEVIKNSTAMGKFDTRSLRQLKETGVATPEQFTKALAESRHVTIKQADAMIKAGRVSPGETASLILDLVQKNVDNGGALGSRSAGLAMDTVSGQLNRMKVLWDNLLESQSMQPAINALKKIGDMLDPATERGKKFQAALGRAFDDVGAAISYLTENNRLETFFSFIESGARAAGFYIGLFAFELGTVTSYVSEVVNGLEMLGSGLFKLDAGLFEAGKNFIYGFLSGIRSGVSEVITAVANLSDSVVDTVRKKLHIASPSKVMEQMGSFTAQGFTLGFENVAPPKLDGLTDIMLPSPKFSTGSLLATAGAGGTPSIGDINLSFQVHVDGAGKNGSELGEEIAQATMQKVRAEIVKFFESRAIED